MIDWQRYPLVRLFLPFLMGIILGYVCTVNRGWTVAHKWIFLWIALCACGLSVSHLLTKKGQKNLGQRAFATFTAICCLSAGFFLSSRSHQQALSQYGIGYQHEIYRQNNFQSESAQQWQQKLHILFTSPERGGSQWMEHRDECAVVEAMTTGRRQELHRQLKQDFARAGISHLLALSGFHVGILFAVLLLIPRQTGLALKWRRTWTICSVAVLWGYALMSGMSPSIVRAVLMCTFYYVFRLFEHSISLINACTLAAFILLSINPLFIGHIGFQLSFCAVTGIALAQPWISHRFPLNAAQICIVCTVATLPLAAFHFGSIPLLGLPVNLLTTLLAPVIIGLYLCWWGVCLIPPMADGIAFLLQWTSRALCWLAHSTASLPFAAVSYEPSVAEVVFLYGTLLTAASLPYKINRRRIIILLLMVNGVFLTAILRKTGIGLCFLIN